jgi:hypothetical protein
MLLYFKNSSLLIYDIALNSQLKNVWILQDNYKCNLAKEGFNEQLTLTVF